MGASSLTVWYSLMLLLVPQLIFNLRLDLLANHLIQFKLLPGWDMYFFHSRACCRLLDWHLLLITMDFIFVFSLSAAFPLYPVLCGCPLSQ